MTEKQAKLKAEVMARIEKQVEENVVKFTEKMDEHTLNIDIIEALWNEVKGNTRKELDVFYNELVNTIPEEGDIQEKKRR